jgi:uncharacterized protein DUF6916
MTERHTTPEPTLTRRRFVQTGAAAASVCVLGSLPAAASATATPAYLRRSSYASRTGAAFSAVGPSGAAVTLRLLAVADLARATQKRSLAGSDDAFALTFAGPANKPLGSGIRKLRHPTLGWISLFITPAGPPAKEQRYEVVVDRGPR